MSNAVNVGYTKGPANSRQSVRHEASLRTHTFEYLDTDGTECTSYPPASCTSSESLTHAQEHIAIAEQYRRSDDIPCRVSGSSRLRECLGSSLLLRGLRIQSSLRTTKLNYELWHAKSQQPSAKEESTEPLGWICSGPDEQFWRVTWL